MSKETKEFLLEVLGTMLITIYIARILLKLIPTYNK
jgi:hypothetical protein